MRDDEELCRRAVASLLREQGLDPEWFDGTEPPDYFLEIRDQRLAVEIMNICGVTELDGQDHPWMGLSPALQSFGQGVCREVEARADVSGCYLVSFPAIPRLKQSRERIVDSLVTYFQTNASRAPEMATQVVLQPEGRDIGVSKVTQEGSVLITLSLPTGAFSTHAADQLTGLLAATIKRKAHKLRAVDKPWVLVILDRYGFQGSMAEWRKGLPPEASNFEAIVRVQKDRAEVVSGNLCEGGIPPARGSP